MPARCHSSSRLTLRRQRGVTVIEVCTVLCVIGIVLGNAAPAFGDMLERRHLEGRAVELATDLQGMRADAVARNRALRISFQRDASGSCYVVHTGSADACTCTGEGPAQCAEGTELVKSVALPRTSHIRLESNVGSMVYDPAHGTTTLGSTLRLTDSKDRSIWHVVNIMGRVRSCSPRGEVQGYRTC
jgi:type IV fimbrial biogenesis protein FimT